MPDRQRTDRVERRLGSHVGSGTALASVVSPSRLSASALISQADIADLKVGQKAQMTIDGYDRDAFTGRISFISSEPASSSSTSGSSSSTQYSITVTAEDLPELAKSGMTGTLDIVIEQAADVLMVPTTAVSGSSTTSYLRVMQDGKPVYRQVQTGMATSSSTEITSGLAAGETVVTGQYTDGAQQRLDLLAVDPLRRQHPAGRRRVPRRRTACRRRRDAHRGRPVIVLLESLRLAFSSLRANPLRAFLTILGIVIGVAAVVALTSIGGGSTKAVVDRFNSFGTDTVTVQSSQFSSNSTAITQSDLKAIQETPGVKSTVYTVGTNSTVSYGTTTAQASVTGTFPQYKAINHLTIKAGTFFTQFDVDHALPVAVLGSTTADDLGLVPLRAIGQTVNVGGVRFRIVGVLASQGGLSFGSVDSAIVVPLSSIEGRLVAFHPDISTIRVQAEPGAKDSLDTAVEATLRTQHGLATSDQNDFQVVDASSISSAVSSSTKTLTRLMAAIAAISLIVGGIGVANVMLVTVRERTREIGVRRAVGATRRDIVVQFLVDAVVISLIGGVIGLIVGFVGAFAGGSALGVTPVFSWTAVILAICVALAVGVFAGIGPAAQASSVEPTNALRWE